MNGCAAKQATNYPSEQGLKALAAAQRVEENPTVEENIDMKIRYLQAEIARLEESKKTLTPLLGLRIRDIREAMNY